MQRKEQKGITLIALVITIIVLLILAGISIAMLTGENGILAQASKAKVETRGASVQEVRDLWFTEKKLNAAKSLDEVLNDLKKQNLLTDEEVAEVKETGQVTIGSRTIVFGEDNNVELVAKVKYDKYEDKYKIAVGFKDYQTYSDHPVRKVLNKCTEQEKEKMFIEIYNDKENTELKTLDEIFKYEYEQGYTSKLCTTLDEYAIETGYRSEDRMLMKLWGDELLIARVMLANSSKEEKENIFLEIVNLAMNANFKSIDEVFKLLYEQKETSKLCTTLEELAIEVKYPSVDIMILALGNQNFEYYWGGKIEEKIKVAGELTDPSGNKAKLSTENIDNYTIVFESYAYEYEITQNGSYKFDFVGDNGQTSSVTVTIDEKHPCIVFGESYAGITLMAGIGNFINPEIARAENTTYMEGMSGPKNFDMTQNIEEDREAFFEEGIKILNMETDKYYDATVILTYNGKEYSTKTNFAIPI